MTSRGSRYRSRTSGTLGSVRRSYVDRYGNVQLNLTRDHLEGAGIVPGSKVELEVGWDRVYAVAARTFADARPGDLVVYEDAYRNIALAISRGVPRRCCG